eukprot:1142103-Alexandrium_andersonii.AAC.1
MSTRTNSFCPEITASTSSLQAPSADKLWGPTPLPRLMMSTSVMNQPMARRTADSPPCPSAGTTENKRKPAGH